MSQLLDRMKTVYGYYSNNHVLGAYPRLIGMELTNHCNLECVMCPQPQQTRDLGLMKEEFFRKVIDEVRTKSEFIYLYGMGESLLHPKFFEMADYAVAANLSTALSTNLSFLNEERSYKLLKSGIDFITLALDGATKETYESIRVGGEFEKNLDQAKSFLRMKNELGSKCSVDVQFIEMDENKTQTNLVSELFTKEEKAAINMFRVKPVFDSPSIVQDIIKHKRPCYFLWSTMDITWDGKVDMCCMDYDAKVILGDLNANSVYDVWNGEEMADLRDKHKKLNYESMPICDKCPVPEMNYFSDAAILSSGLLSASTLRKGLALYEKFFVADKRNKSNSDRVFID
jgi:hypothetical protein